MAELTMVASMLRHLSLSEAAAGLESIVADAALAEDTPLEVLNKLLQMEIDGRNAKGKLGIRNAGRGYCSEDSD